MEETDEFAGRYAAVWNEPDPDHRHRRVRELWAADAVHVLQPPEEVLTIAATLGMTAAFEARGHDALELRVARAYEMFVAPGEYLFRPRGNAAHLRDVIKLNWEMARTDDGTVVAVGLEFLVMSADGRIHLDYQFIEA